MVPALHEGGGVIVAGAADGGERLIGVDIHAAQRVDDADEACKVDADVMVYVDAVEVAQRFHAGLHAVQTGMGQLVFVAGARQVHIVVAGGVDEDHPLGHRVHGGEDVHVAAGFFGQLTAGVHAAEVDNEGLFGDLVGLGAGEQAGGHAAQRGKALLRPDAAHGHGGAQEHREHAGHLAGHVILLAAFHQQPQQGQQRRQNDEVEHWQHLGAPQLHQCQHAQNALHGEQNLAKAGGHGSSPACVRRGRAAAAIARRLRRGRTARRRSGLRRGLGEKGGAVHHNGAVLVLAGLPAEVPQGTVGIIFHTKISF